MKHNHYCLHFYFLFFYVVTHSNFQEHIKLLFYYKILRVFNVIYLLKNTLQKKFQRYSQHSLLFYIFFFVIYKAFYLEKNMNSLRLKKK